jgi:hypothetical protein
MTAQMSVQTSDCEVQFTSLGTNVRAPPQMSRGCNSLIIEPTTVLLISEASMEHIMSTVDSSDLPFVNSRATSFTSPILDVMPDRVSECLMEMMIHTATSDKTIEEDQLVLEEELIQALLSATCPMEEESVLPKGSLDSWHTP